MNRKVIKTEADYQKAVKRMIVIFHAEEATQEAEELAQLLILIKNYEDKHSQVSGLNGVENVGMIKLVGSAIRHLPSLEGRIEEN